MFVVLTDVAQEFSLKFGCRRKDAAGDDVAFDLGEPQLHLVEPGEIREGDVQINAQLLGDKLIDPLSLMRRPVVGDQVDFLP